MQIFLNYSPQEPPLQARTSLITKKLICSIRILKPRAYATRPKGSMGNSEYCNLAVMLRLSVLKDERRYHKIYLCEKDLM